MPTVPTVPTPAPTAPDRSDRSTFNSRATTWADYQKNNLVPEMYGLASNAYANALEAAAAAAAKNIDSYKGAYSAGATYAQGDSVTYNGEFWISNVNGNIGNTPVEGANWSRVAETITVATSTASVTLTSTSAYIQSMTPTEYGQCFTLPAANTLTIKKSHFLLENPSDLPVGVRDGAGTLKYVIPPRSSTIVACRDISSVAGKWVFDREGAVGMPTVAKRLDGYAVASHQPYHISAAILSSTLAVFLVNNGSNHLYIVAANPSTGEVGTPFLIEAASISDACEVHAVTATTAGVKWKSGSNLKAAVVTFTTATATPSLGTVASLAWSGALVGSSYAKYVAACSASLHVLAAQNGSTDIQAAAVTFSGTTAAISATTVAAVTGFTGVVQNVRTAVIDATRAVIWGVENSSSTARIAAVSVAGTTITPGATATFSAGGAGNDIEVVVCSGTQLAAAGWDSGTNYNFYAIALSTITLTVSAAAHLSIAVSTGTNNGSSTVRTGYPLSATEVLFSYQNSNNDWRQSVLTVSGSSTPANAPIGPASISSSVQYLTEPASDYWPVLNYSNTTGVQSYLDGYTRSGSTISRIGRLKSDLRVNEVGYSCKLSGAYTWLYMNHAQGSPRALVIKKVGTSLQSIGEIPLAIGYENLKSTFAQSGQKIAFQASVGASSVPVLNCIELVS
jgi:hypothetical protein